MPNDEAAWHELCLSTTKGAWRAKEAGVFDLHGCANLCRRCDNCRWVSYSPSQGDCSWFQRCDPSNLSMESVTDFTTMHVHGANLDTALAALPTVYHQSLPCSITQVPSDPGVACAVGPAQPCWMRTSYTFHLNGMYEPDAQFEPDFVWALQGEAPAIEIRGGECASCSFPYRGRSFTYLGLCLQARLKLADAASQTSVVGVRCIKSADENARPRNLVLGVFSGYHGIWQHQMFNGLPNLGMVMPLMHAGVANISLLHNGLLDATENAIGNAVAPAACLGLGSPSSWRKLRAGHDVRNGDNIQNLVVPIPMPTGVGHEDSYPRFAYSWTTGGRPGVRRARNGFIALLSRPNSTSRSLVQEQSIIVALRRVFKEVGMHLRVAHNWPLDRYRNAVALIGVHGGGLSNMVAMPSGSRIIEIVDRRGPRCFASAALGLGHDYHAYFPRRMPRPPTEAPNDPAWFDSHGSVEVDVPHFTAFVREVFLPTKKK